MHLSVGALPRQLPRCARRAFAKFVCDPCVVIAAYNGHQDSPLSRDSPPREPCQQPPLSDDRPSLVPCHHALSHDSPSVQCLVLSPYPTTVSCRVLCHAPLSLLAPSLQASVDVLPAMDVTNLVVPRVRRFVPFVGNKDQGEKDAGQKDVEHKDGAP